MKKQSVNWSDLSYSEMVKEVEKLVGKRPMLPENAPKVEWTSQATRVLVERYFLKDENGNSIEDVNDMCWRVAWELASCEVKFGKTSEEVKKLALDYYNLMIKRWFLPNSPTLMNAGKGNGLQYSACYVLPVEDSLSGIFDGIKYQAIVHQSGGGTGFSFSRLRPSGARVKSTMGVASGPVSFMRIYNEATQQIKQGGMRRGANMGILRVDHPDVMEFIHCKEQGGITNFNISVAITDRFMEALFKNEDYDLVDPHTKKVTGQLSAKKVWDEIAQGAWRTGDPGLIFLDRINNSAASPIRAEGWEVESTNPCVTGDTLISTQDGLVPMKEVVESHFEGGSRHGGNMGMIIDTRSIDMEAPGITKGQAFVFYDNGEKDVFKLVTKSGFELKATADHRVLTTSGWQQIQNLKTNDKILIQSAEGEFSKNYFLPFTPEKSTLPTQWTKELGQVVGWLVGDGWLRSGDKNCRVGFTFGKDDQELMALLTKTINKWYGKEIVPIARQRNTHHLSYHGKHLVNFFLSLGVKPVKAEEKEVPYSIYTAPKEAVVGFIQGLFTADGTVRDSRKSNSDWVALTSKSKTLLQGVQLLLLNMGIKSRLFDRSRGERQGMFPYTNKNGVKKTYTLDGKLYELGIFGDFREQFKTTIGFLNQKQLKLEHTRKRNTKRLRDAFVDTVVSVEYFGREKVYDLTELVSHSMITNGIIVHQCGEQPLYPFDACNLGSIFLGYFVKDKKVDWAKLKEVTHMSVRMLDSVIEMNPFPLPQIADTVKKIRRIGLGVGGWADMLVRLRIPYDSEEALELAEKIMKFINEQGHKASQNLARERGAFPMWNQSIYKDDKPIRNSTVTTIAPTGTIGILANASGGVEPKFAIAYQHIVKSENRTLNFVDELFEEAAKERGIWTEELKEKLAEEGTVAHIEAVPEDLKRVFVTAHEIVPQWHVKTQAAFQKYTDNAVSKTINLANSASVKDIQDAYMLSWTTNCRGITVFRDGCKGDQVLNVGVKKEEKKVEEKPHMLPLTNGHTNGHIPQLPSNGYLPFSPESGLHLINRPFVVQGSTYKLKTPVGSAFITINQDEAGQPLEVFINIGRAGSDVAAMADALGRTISTALRFRGALPPSERAKEIAEQLSGIGGRSSVGFGPNKIRSLPDAVSLALSTHFGLNGNTNSIVGVQRDLAEAAMTADVPSSGGLVQSSLGHPDRVAAAAESPSTSAADLCPSCGEHSLIYEEGCAKCYSCGHSQC